MTICMNNYTQGDSLEEVYEKCETRKLPLPPTERTYINGAYIEAEGFNKILAN